MTTFTTEQTHKMSKVRVGQQVRVALGRNKGEVSNVTHLGEDGTTAYADFARQINVNEGFGSIGAYVDAYWIAVEDVVVV